MYCWNCGVEIVTEGSSFCSGCGAALTGEKVALQQSARRDTTMRYVMPVDVSPMAFASGYLGLFSLLLLPAPLAIITGVLGLRDIACHPERTGKGRAIFGIAMGLVCTIGLVWMAISEKMR